MDGSGRNLSLRLQVLLMASGALAEQTEKALLHQGCAVTRLTGREQLERLSLFPTYDLVLVEARQPEGSAIPLLERLGLRARMAVVLIGETSSQERARALDCAADDHVTLPMDGAELAGRLRNILRLRRQSSTCLEFRGWMLDLIRRELFHPDGSPQALTPGEFNILAALAARWPEAASRDFLLGVVSSRDPRAVTPHTVDTIIARLRRKLGDQPGGPRIVTVRGIGYALT